MSDATQHAPATPTCMLVGPRGLQHAPRLAAVASAAACDVAARLVASASRGRSQQAQRLASVAAEALQKPQEPGPEDCCQARPVAANALHPECNCLPSLGCQRLCSAVSQAFCF